MRVRLKHQCQQKIIMHAIKKAGSEEKLSEILKIPKSSIYGYKTEKNLLPLERFNVITSFLSLKNQDIKTIVVDYLPDNWGRRLGGINCVKSKKHNGSFLKNIEHLKILSSKRMKLWHKKMRTETPEDYYKIQYSRFKKVGGYKFKTQNGEIVRNKLELDVANLLFSLKIPYQYEPLVKGKKNYYFPDFLIHNNVIIETTMWRGEQKAYKLMKKIVDLKARGYKIFVVIPEDLREFYMPLDRFIVSDLNQIKGII